MTQDPSGREPADPTAAPEPDTAWAAPPSWPPAPDPPPGDATQAVDIEATGEPTGGRPAATPDPGAATTGGPPVVGVDLAGAGEAPPASGGPGAPPYGTPAHGVQPHDPSGYGPPPPGYMAPPPAGFDPGNAYGGHPPPGIPGQGAYPPGGYGHPAYPPYYAPPTNVMAILSLVFIVVFPPVGLVFGFVARSQITRTGESGDGLALAGIIVNGFFTVLGVLFVIGVVIAVAGAGPAG